MATRLCEGGHVRVNSIAAKPSTKVGTGDVVHALIAERERILEVVPVIREIAPGVNAVGGSGYVNNSQDHVEGTLAPLDAPFPTP